MRGRVLVSGLMFCAVGLLLTVAGAQSGKDDHDESGDVEFKSSQAKAVRSTYLRGLADAEKESNRKVLEATQAYQQGLRAPLTAATKAGNLDEANRLDAEIKRVTAELADMRKGEKRKGEKRKPTTGQKLVIERARYGMVGMEHTWVDVTREMKAAIRDGGLGGLGAAKRAGGDPMPGQRKTLEIIGTLDGKRFSLHMRDGDPFDTYFGVPKESN